MFTGSASKFQRWKRDWNRDQCATVAQLRTGHSPLLAGYLHRIGRRDSTTCPHCNGADETAEHLVLHCSAHEQARMDIWLGGLFNTDPRRLWEFLERIRAVTPPPTGNERERERENDQLFTIYGWIYNITLSGGTAECIMDAGYCNTT